MNINTRTVSAAIAIIFSPLTLAADCSSDPSYTPISSAPFVAYEGGKYCLVNDLDISVADLYEPGSSPSTALWFELGESTEQSLIIDLNNHTISYKHDDAGVNTAGIFAWAADSVLIKNGMIKDFDIGIVASSVLKLTVNNIDIAALLASGDIYGIRSYEGQSLDVTNSSFFCGEDLLDCLGGFESNFVDNVSITNVNVAGPMRYGIAVGNAENAKVTHSIVQGSGSLPNEQWNHFGINLGAEKSTAVSNTISGFEYGLRSGGTGSTYSRMSVSAIDAAHCFDGGKSVGTQNTCTSSP